MNQNRSKTQKCSKILNQKCNNFSTRSVSTNCWYTSGWNINTFLCFTTILVQKLLHFWVLLQFWFKSYYVSGFTTLLVIYYVSGSYKGPLFTWSGWLHVHSKAGGLSLQISVILIRLKETLVNLWFYWLEKMVQNKISVCMMFFFELFLRFDLPLFRKFPWKIDWKL